MSYTEKDVVTMAHGSGGQAMQQYVGSLERRRISATAAPVIDRKGESR